MWDKLTKPSQGECDVCREATTWLSQAREEDHPWLLGYWRIHTWRSCNEHHAWMRTSLQRFIDVYRERVGE